MIICPHNHLKRYTFIHLFYLRYLCRDHLSSFLRNLCGYNFNHLFFQMYYYKNLLKTAKLNFLYYFFLSSNQP